MTTSLILASVFSWDVHSWLVAKFGLKHQWFGGTLRQMQQRHKWIHPLMVRDVALVVWTIQGMVTWHTASTQVLWELLWLCMKAGWHGVDSRRPRSVIRIARPVHRVLCRLRGVALETIRIVKASRNVISMVEIWCLGPFMDTTMAQFSTISHCS